MPFTEGKKEKKRLLIQKKWNTGVGQMNENSKNEWMIKSPVSWVMGTASSMNFHLTFSVLSLGEQTPLF